jgi:serine protease inhibitor
MNFLFPLDASLKDNLMLIVSALYFQGLWYRQPFSVNDTKNEAFIMSDGKTALQVPFMKTSNRFYFAYINELDSKILRLPYAVSAISHGKNLFNNF